MQRGAGGSGETGEIRKAQMIRVLGVESGFDPEVSVEWTPKF